VCGEKKRQERSGGPFDDCDTKFNGFFLKSV
jgi:hypothetical protein